MELYIVEKDYLIEIEIDNKRVTYLFLAGETGGKSSADRIYFAPSDEIIRVIERFRNAGYPDFDVKVFINKEEIFKHPEFPLNLTYSGGYFKKKEKFIPLEEKIKPLINKEKIRIAIVNGMGGGLGDNIVGMSALNIFYEELSKHFKEVVIDIFTLRPKAFPIFEKENIINHFYLMPSPLHLLFKYDAFVDFSNMTGWSTFQQEMIDFYLLTMGIEPKKIPSFQKRCCVKINKKVAKELLPVIKSLKSSKKKLLLFHPVSSTKIRSIPPDLIPKYLKSLLKNEEVLVISLVPIKYNHTRFVDLSDYSSQGFDYFAYLVSQMDYIVTVDTVTYHLADAFNIPTVVFFTSIPPEHRISYYPLVEGIHIGKEISQDFYKHFSEDSKEIEMFKNFWKKFDIKEVFPMLKELEKKKRDYSSRRCSICEGELEDFPADRYGKNFYFRCRTCEAENIFPSQIPKERLERVKNIFIIKDEYSKSYLEKKYYEFVSSSYFFNIKNFLETLPIKKNLLDIGCRTGFLVRFAKEIGFSAYGIEENEEFIECGKKFLKLKSFLEISPELTTLPKNFPSKFQVITVLEVIEFVKNPLEFLKNWVSFLETNGFLIISTINSENIGELIGINGIKNYFLKLIQKKIPKYSVKYSLTTHKVLFQKLGLKLLWQKTIPLTPQEIVKVAGEKFKKLDLNVTTENGEMVKVYSEDILPFMFETLAPLVELVSEYGFYIISIGIKEGGKAPSFEE